MNLDSVKVNLGLFIAGSFQNHIVKIAITFDVADGVPDTGGAHPPKQLCEVEHVIWRMHCTPNPFVRAGRDAFTGPRSELMLVANLFLINRGGAVSAFKRNRTKRQPAFD